jgi:WhiB family transcriptional regulator, redox-sensing transcriptional regulator
MDAEQREARHLPSSRSLGRLRRTWSISFVNVFTRVIRNYQRRRGRGEEAVSPTARMLFNDNGTDWRRSAACRGCDVELFFPVGSTGPAISQIDAAKAVCGHCPVRADCLDFALVTNQEAGVWGGATEEERRRLRRSWLAQRRRRLLASPQPAPS